MKRVLMIAYPFPPMGGSGVHRTVKFAKYLPEFGWEPIILTVKAKRANWVEEYDATLLRDLPDDLQVYQTICPDLDTIRGLLSRRSNVSDNQQGPAQERGNVGANHRNVRWLLRRVKSLVDTSIFIPDDEIGWLPFATVKALQIARDCNVDLIYSTSNPYTDHLIGAIVKRLTRKPWVADFRDPWTDNIYHSGRYYGGRLGWVRKAIDTRLEQYVLASANCVIATTERTRDSLAHKCSRGPRSRFISITNGFDAADFRELHPRRVSGSFTIVYNGSFRRFSPEPFLRGLKLAIVRNKLDVKMIFVGNIGWEYEEMIDKMELRPNVCTIGYQQHQDSLGFVLGADLLLLILTSDPREAQISPAKLYEYMAARKPILAVAPEGVTANLVRQMGLGCVVSAESPDEIAKAIMALYEKYSIGELMVSDDIDLEPFERRSLTNKLSKVFDSLIGQQESFEGRV